MNLHNYPCGVKLWDRLRLNRDLEQRDRGGRLLKTISRAGDIWIVHSGDPQLPNEVYLERPDGEPHMWEDDDIFDWFEKVR